MNNDQDKIKDIIAQLQRLQIRESELLLRLERLSVGTNKASLPTVTPRVFVLGDLVTINNPRPLQARKGTITRIGIGTDRITVTAKNGSKIVRAPFNLTLIV